MDTRNQSVTASVLNIIAGIWLIISPFVIGFVNPAARTNDLWVGVIVGILAIIRVAAPMRTVWLSWINLILGIWLIISPFVLGNFSTGQTWNDVILGILVGAFAIWSASSAHVDQGRHAGA